MTTYSEAMTRLRSNKRAVWSPRTREDDASTFAISRIHHDFADVVSPKPFKFQRGQRFFCVGSCFAREIEDAITLHGGYSETRERSLKLVSDRPDLFARSANVIGRPNAFLNRYNSASMALLIDDIATNCLSDRLLYGQQDKIDFHYTRFIRPLSLEPAMERRSALRSMYAEALRASDVFVFTLGLCEAFVDTDHDTYLNVTPDPKAAAGRNIEFRFLDVADNLRSLRTIVKSLRSIRPNAEVVLTVSPVPLDATFTEMDIVVANSLAKESLNSGRLQRRQWQLSQFSSDRAAPGR